MGNTENKQTALMSPGRSCPIHYRYKAQDIAASPASPATVLYVVGGLYGNTEALTSILALIQKETSPVTLCFNGDFNWFNIDSEAFGLINWAVLQHDVLRGNVETEISDVSSEGDCGCAYPAWVDTGVVERSNLIINRLKRTASGYPDIAEAFRSMPMYLRYQVGEHRIAVVHGDCESLSGWALAQEAIDDPAQQRQIEQWSEQTGCRVIASTHTCLPYLYQSKTVQVINNGAAGMPNFRNTHYGCISRIATEPRPATIDSLYGSQDGGLFIDAVPVHYRQPQWLQAFERQWPPGSPAYLSYYERLLGNLAYELKDAQRLS
ncbi:MAG: hypothetical protein KTR32_23720 [Granulosicoccus sp.]|nr:hypothetical protein [Granulosicoccus sp.]